MTEAEIRADERHKCWKEINALMIPGDLPGMGVEPAAQRNGLILAANQILDGLTKNPAFHFREVVN